MNQWQADWYQRNKDRVKAKQLQYNHEHREERNAYRRKYVKLNPEKIIQNTLKFKPKMKDYKKKSLIKLAKLAGVSLNELYYGLKTWSKRVRERDNHICLHCGNKATSAHHILSKNAYPKLIFVDNNGISLCDKCHDEIHGREGKEHGN